MTPVLIFRVPKNFLFHEQRPAPFSPPAAGQIFRAIVHMGTFRFMAVARGVGLAGIAQGALLPHVLFEDPEENRGGAQSRDD